MKKIVLFIIVFLVLAGTVSVAQMSKQITVYGFEGEKPLFKNSTVFVDYPEKGMQGIATEAFKGETEVSFLKRINLDNNKLETKYIPIYIKKNKTYLSLKEMEDSVMSEKKIVESEKSQSIHKIKEIIITIVIVSVVIFIFISVYILLGPGPNKK